MKCAVVLNGFVQLYDEIRAVENADYVVNSSMTLNSEYGIIVFGGRESERRTGCSSPISSF